MLPIILLIAAIAFLIYTAANGLAGIDKQLSSRKDYYRNVYLKSDDWKRKRYVVLRRDNWRCVYCGARATQVHHKRYARINIGKEPIDWLVSVCKACHEDQHSIKRLHKARKNNHS